VSTVDRATRRRRTRAARRRPWLRVAVAVVGATLLLAIGIAVGLALGDRPQPGGEQTIVRTLEPLPQQQP
jgi:hypothetical protein